MLIHVLACVGMPAEITIYLSADHIRAEESSRGIKEVGRKKNYAGNDYLGLAHFSLYGRHAVHHGLLLTTESRCGEISIREGLLTSRCVLEGF